MPRNSSRDGGFTICPGRACAEAVPGSAAIASVAKPAAPESKAREREFLNLICNCPRRKIHDAARSFYVYAAFMLAANASAAMLLNHVLHEVQNCKCLVLDQKWRCLEESPFV
jgi:hypothetical protein